MKLLKLRQQANLSQQEVAKKIGITQEKYSRLENNVSKLNSDILIKLSNIYNVSIDYLLDKPNIDQIGYIPADRINLIKYLINAPYNIINQVEIFIKGYNSGKSDQKINFYTPDEI